MIAAASEADAERALAVLERAGKGSMAAAVTIQMEICVDPARQIVTWLRSHRRGAHGGAFTCVDDVIAAIEWQFGEEDRDVH
ncbi:MAG: hypothetical protein Q8O56_06290 [Solirubrobacteraceae bacterium]|nr:hypothetical protein [Solirubrobacteraceae bacterium]